MVKRIEEMLCLQKDLDDRILKGKDYPIDKMKLALLAEVGEALAEKESLFKHWKKEPIDNNENFLKELVDVFHFMLSIELYYNGALENVIPNNLLEISETIKCVYSAVYQNYIEDSDLHILAIFNENSFTAFFLLLKSSGFTFDDLYNGYIEKNKINHDRQDNNY